MTGRVEKAKSILLQRSYFASCETMEEFDADIEIKINKCWDE